MKYYIKGITACAVMFLCATASATKELAPANVASCMEDAVQHCGKVTKDLRLNNSDFACLMKIALGQSISCEEDKIAKKTISKNCQIYIYNQLKNGHRSEAINGGGSPASESVE